MEHRQELTPELRSSMLQRVDPALIHSWNAFKNKDPARFPTNDPNAYKLTGGYPGSMSFQHPDHRRFSYGVDKTIVSAIFQRLALDVAMCEMRHVRLDENGTFRGIISSGLNNCLTKEANIDQTGFALRIDMMLSLLDEGVIAVVAVDTTLDPAKSSSYDIKTMRVGKIVQWRPSTVRVRLYNDQTGWHDEVELEKKDVAIIENPFYAVMNEPISMLKRLTRKLALLDTVDEQNSSGKLDMIIQLPYTIKSSTRLEQAEKRREQLIDQLANSQYGIGYIDGTERITQLNRPVENQLMSQIEYYTSILYGQLGINADIMNGTASEDVMQNYYKRTIDVFLKAICDEFTRTFLTKTARTQGQAIKWYRDPFSLTPTSLIADIADKFTRNEILSPNEVRGVVGFMPSDDVAADELRNRNLNQTGEATTPPAMASGFEGEEPATEEPVEGPYGQEENAVPQEEPIEVYPEDEYEEPIEEYPEDGYEESVEEYPEDYPYEEYLDEDPQVLGLDSLDEVDREELLRRLRR